MPRYSNVQEVKNLLIGKVRFSDDDSDENRMGPKLMKQLMDEAETMVELQLARRYQTPILGMAGEEFSKLINVQAKTVISTIGKLQCCMRLLETDFGKGSAVAGDEYYKNLSKRYDSMMEILIGERDDSHGFKYPPLQGIQLNWGNQEADDGFPGAILNTSRMNDIIYAEEQINNPAESFWNTGFK